MFFVYYVFFQMKDCYLKGFLWWVLREIKRKEKWKNIFTRNIENTTCHFGSVGSSAFWCKISTQTCKKKNLLPAPKSELLRGYENGWYKYHKKKKNILKILLLFKKNQQILKKCSWQLDPDPYSCFSWRMQNPDPNSHKNEMDNYQHCLLLEVVN